MQKEQSHIHSVAAYCIIGDTPVRRQELSDVYDDDSRLPADTYNCLTQLWSQSTSFSIVNYPILPLPMCIIFTLALVMLHDSLGF